MHSSQLLKGMLELAALAVLSRRPAYGLELLEGLRSAGLTPLGDPSVYGVLRRLESDGFLASWLSTSPAGPARKYFQITGKGRAALAEATGDWQRLARALDRILEDDIHV